MNVPNLPFWWHLLATLGLEVGCLGALAFLVGRILRSAISQKTVWQITVICLLLLPLSEWTGFGRGVARFLFGQKPTLAGAAGPPISLHSQPLSWRKLLLPPIGSLTPQHAVWWPGWVWATGTVIVFIRMTAGQILLLTLRLRREGISDRVLRERVGQVANKLGLRREINLLRMPQAISPMAFGLFQPKIGLPPNFEAQYTRPEQEAVLAHELAHLAANDPKWFLLADFATAMLWWHPLAWWVRRNLHDSAELAADEATALVPDGPDALAKCLVVLGQKMIAPRGWGWIGINGGFQSRLGLRVERLLRLSKAGARPPVVSVPLKLVATLVVLPSVVFLCGALQSAQGQKQDTWKEEMSVSWHSSPGALVLLAALDDKQKQTVYVPTQVQNAKLLYEMGKLNEAEAILPQPIPLTSTAQTMFIPLTWDAQPMFIPLDSTANPFYVGAPAAERGTDSRFDPSFGLESPIEPKEPAGNPSAFFLSLADPIPAMFASAAGSPSSSPLEGQQIGLVVHFTELPEKDDPVNTELDGLFTHLEESAWIIKNTLVDLYPDLKLPPQRNVIADYSQTQAQAAILSTEKVAAIKNQTTSDWLAAPRLTVLVGRRARVSVNDLKTIVFDVQTTNGTAAKPTPSVNYLAADVPLGPMAEISSEPEEGGLRLDVHARYAEFLGYDSPGSAVVEARGWTAPNLPPAQPLKGVLPRPHFRIREAKASVVLNPGQTVVLRGPSAIDLQKVTGTGSGKSASLRLYVFVSLELAHD